MSARRLLVTPPFAARCACRRTQSRTTVSWEVTTVLHFSIASALRTARELKASGGMAWVESTAKPMLSYGNLTRERNCHRIGRRRPKKEKRAACP